MGLLTSETNAFNASSVINIKFQFTCIFGLLVLMAGIKLQRCLRVSRFAFAVLEAHACDRQPHL